MVNKRRTHRLRALGLFLLVSCSGVIYYLVNNFYGTWAYDPSTPVWAVLITYYFATQPIYIVCLWLFYQRYGKLGIVAGILLTVSLDLSSIPHSFPSLFNVNDTTPLPSNSNLAPYADWQLGKLLAVNGILTFWHVISIVVIIPIIFNLIVFLIVTPEAYEAMVEQL